MSLHFGGDVVKVSILGSKIIIGIGSLHVHGINWTACVLGNEKIPLKSLNSLYFVYGGDQLDYLSGKRWRKRKKSICIYFRTLERLEIRKS